MMRIDFVQTHFIRNAFCFFVNFVLGALNQIIFGIIISCLFIRTLLGIVWGKSVL